MTSLWKIGFPFPGPRPSASRRAIVSIALLSFLAARYTVAPFLKSCCVTAKPIPELVQRIS